MPSQFENPELDHFFQRLNKPLAKMPVQERADVHAEMRQHLDALIAAHEELGLAPAEALQAAVRQFGNPARVGRRMAREWERKNCVPTQINWRIGVFFLFWLNGFGLVKCVLPGLMGEWVFHQSVITILVARFAFLLGPLLIAGALTGGRFGRAAIPHIFYASLANDMSVAIIYHALGFVEGASHVSRLSTAITFVYNYVLYLPTLAAISCAAAYLAGARREGGWYRLRGSDLTLRLR